MGFSMNGVPLSYESDYYLIWKMRMQDYLEEKGIVVWNSVVTGYTPPKKVKITAQKEAKKNNSMAMEAILEGLADIQKKKIGKCILAKELWLRSKQHYSIKE